MALVAMNLRALALALLCASCVDARINASAAPANTNAEEHEVGGKTAQEVFANDEGLRALATASCAGRVEDVALTIQQGGDPNGEGLDGVTPLIWAQSCDSLPGMEALLQGGANPDRHFYNSNAVWIAASAYRVEQLELLLRFGGDVNFVDDYGDTVLIASIRRGHNDDDWENFELLLRSEVSINQVTSRGRNFDGEGQPVERLGTAAQFAAHMLEYDRVVQLLELGCNVRLRHLARAIEVQIEDGAPTPPEQVRWRERAREMLIERGVQFPVGPIQ